MKNDKLIAEMQRLAAQPGIVGCALVDADAGLVWHACDARDDVASMWEAAVDHWRLHRRQREHTARLGELGAALFHHTGGILAVLPCCIDPPLLLVARADHRSVDWGLWQRMARRLGEVVKSSL